MDAQILQELETAAQILLASPNLVTSEQRHAAECIFLNFKKTKSPYRLCLQILETSKVDYVLFEVAGLLKDALIREWSFLQESDISSLRQYILQYVLERPTLPPFVREKMLQVIAIVCKRGSLDEFGNHRDPKQLNVNSHSNHRALMLNEIEHLIMNGTHSQKLVGCSLLAAVLQEYSVTVKSSDVGLSIETHYKAKENFGLNDLKRIFQFCCRALNSIVGSEQQFSNESLSLMKQILSVSETILTWDFGFSVRYGVVDVSAYNVSFIPSHSWRDVLLDPQLVNLFFTIYWKIRLSPQLSHHAMTCLVQLAGVVESEIFNQDERVSYTENFQKEIMKLITSVEILDREALGISNIIKKIFIPFLSPSATASQIKNEYYEQIASLTCNFIEGAAAEEVLFAEDRLYMEAFDIMMDFWMEMLFSWTNLFPSQLVKQTSQKIFNVYLKCHLSPPEGTRGQGKDLEAEEVDESDEIDRIKFKSQLETIGAFAQLIPEYSLPLLARLLEDRAKILSNHVDKLFHQGPTISDSSALVYLFEDLHWLLLISGSVTVTDNVKTCEIPTKLMSYSVAQSPNISIETTLKVFGSPDKDFNCIEDAEKKTDHLIRLISAVFRLGHLFKKFIEAKLAQFLSPEVISSMLWFFRKWSMSYLLPKESLYTEISMALVCAFGRDSEGGVWTLNYLLEQVVTYLMHFNSEPGVSQDAVNLFISLTDSKEKSVCVLKSDYLPTIISIQSRLPETVKRDVYQGLARAAIACQNECSRNEYWTRILKPLQDRWRAIVCHESFSRIYQEERTKTELMDVLDCLTGVVKGSSPSNAEPIFQYLSPIFSDFPTLVGVYRNYQQIVELVFEFFSECALNLFFLPHNSKKNIYESCIQTIQTYSKCNVGRLSLHSNAQEETFNDIYLLLKLLKDLLPSDYYDLYNLESVMNIEQSLMPADVCIYGLNLIMPLMTDNLFKYPPLCLEYFKFNVRLSEMYPEKICQLPERLLRSMLYSVELGLTSLGQDIFGLCCDFLNHVGVHICKMGPPEPGRSILKPFLKLILTLIVSHSINSDNLPEAGSALFVLICCYIQDYKLAVEALLNAHPPDVAEPLAKAFLLLTRNLTLKYSIQQSGQFNQNLLEFVAKTHGILYVK